MSTTKSHQKKVVIAPLNWGWGHATRCIPIVHEIKNLGFTPVIASDGDALKLLQKEFPKAEFIKLPSYRITYHRFFILSMVFNLPKIAVAIFREYFVIKKYILKNKSQIIGLISDNRLGVFSKQIKSAYITHQLNMRLGVFSKPVNAIHHYFIKKHQTCWVPDNLGSKFSGALSKHPKINIKYIGILSRFKPQQISKKYDLLVLLSGIEGQRKSLEKIMSLELKKFKGKVLLVRGTFKPCTTTFFKNVKVVDFLLSDTLETAINASHMVLSRSGYTTVMDLVTLKKQAFYIPTPKQTEQEYLAKYLQDQGVASFTNQKTFKIEMLSTKQNEQSFKTATKTELLANELRKFLGFF